MNNLTRKLIRDGSARRRIRINLSCLLLGVGLAALGAACLFGSTSSGETALSVGQWYGFPLHLLVGAALVYSGFVVFLVTDVKKTVALLRGQSRRVRIRCL